MTHTPHGVTTCGHRDGEMRPQFSGRRLGPQKKPSSKSSPCPANARLRLRDYQHGLWLFTRLWRLLEILQEAHRLVPVFPAVSSR